MAERADEDRLRAEVRGLRRGMLLLITLASLAVAASIIAIVLVLRSERPREAPVGPRTLVTDRIVTTELYFAFNSDSGAARLFGSPLVRLREGSKGLDVPRLRMRPDRIEMGIGTPSMRINAGGIDFFGPGPSAMSMSTDSLRLGLQLIAPDNWHSWPVDTLRPRRFDRFGRPKR